MHIWGYARNGKRFAFCQNVFILRTSGILEVIHMENTGKGTKDVRQYFEDR